MDFNYIKWNWNHNFVFCRCIKVYKTNILLLLWIFVYYPVVSCCVCVYESLLLCKKYKKY